MVKLTTEASQTLNHVICEDSHSAISSRESADGHMQLDLLDGLMNDLSGLDQRHASRLAQQATKRGKTMKGTYGLNSLSLSGPANQQPSWVNRLVQQFDLDGSTECLLTWKVKDTPQGRSLFQLAPSMRRTSEIDYGLWATPNTMDSMPPRSVEAMERQFNTTRKGRTAPANLREQVHFGMYPTALWPTPRATKTEGYSSKGFSPTLYQVATGYGPDQAYAQTEKPGALNPEFPCWLMGYPQEWMDAAP